MMPLNTSSHSFFEAISNQILKRSRQVIRKDGSQGLDSIVSLHQYHLAYSVTLDRVEAGAKVLDWGGGSGHFSYFLVQAGYDATIFAFDHPDFVKPEVEQDQIKLVLAARDEPTLLPFEDESFDAVFSIGVLEHVRETGGQERASLQEISRILKPGGSFICYHFPNKTSWIERLSRLLGRYSHQYTYDRANIEEIFRSVMDVQEVRRYALLPRNSLRRLPSALSNARWFARTVDRLDAVLSKLLPHFSQNWLIVARKVKP